MTPHFEEEAETVQRTRFAVAMDLRLTIEISAHDEEEAIQLLTDAFNDEKPYDPLLNKHFTIQGYPEANPQIMTAITIEETDTTINVWEV